MTTPALDKIPDKILYARCKEFGTNARHWQRKFAGLLPEVLKRRLHKKRGYGSIHEFAFKLAGMNQSLVEKILRLAQRLEDKPHLKEQLVSGQEGWSKIEKVAFIATSETDQFWAEKVSSMPRLALEAYVQAKRREYPICLSAPGSEIEPEKLSTLFFKVKPSVEEQLRLYKQNLEKEQKEPLSFEEVMESLLNDKGSGRAQVQLQICPECAKRKVAESSGRAIPRLVQHSLTAQYGGICGFRACHKPADSVHHTRRFSLNPSHDPEFLVPLCKAHERLIHTGLIPNEEENPADWRLAEHPDPNNKKFAIDQKVAQYRKDVTPLRSSVG
jgi:hypothetical protein